MANSILYQMNITLDNIRWELNMFEKKYQRLRLEKDIIFLTKNIHIGICDTSLYLDRPHVGRKYSQGFAQYPAI